MSDWNPPLPAKYANVSYDDVPANVRAAFENIRNTKRGLYLHGMVGVGKTHIAYALHKNAPKAGIRTKFWNTVELYQDMREEISRDKYSKEHAIEKATEYPGILILDDVGVEKPTDFVLEAFYLMVNKRYNEMRPMIFTSNYSLNKLADRVGDRIPSRIAEMCDIIKIEGGDRRLLPRE